MLVAFDQDDASNSYVLGYLWNGQDTPPSTDPNLRTIRSVNGHEIQIYDPPVSGGDQGYIRLQYARGDGAMNVVEINNTGIVIQSDSSITLSAPTITVNGRPVSITPSPI